MSTVFLRALSMIGTTACVSAAASVTVIALSGKPVRMAITTSSGQVLVEINPEAYAVPGYPDELGQEMLVASSVMR